MPAQRQWLPVQASPRHTVGSCSQTAPRGGNPNTISILLTPRVLGETTAQGRAELPRVTQCLSHSGNTHGCPPGPSPTRRHPKGRVEVR